MTAERSRHAPTQSVGAIRKSGSFGGKQGTGTPALILKSSTTTAKLIKLFNLSKLGTGTPALIFITNDLGFLGKISAGRASPRR